MSVVWCSLVLCCMTTYFVFLNLSQHVEIRVDDIPLLSEGTEIDFDLMVRSPRSSSATKRVFGIHKVHRRLLKFGGKNSGLVQYLEFERVQL